MDTWSATACYQCEREIPDGEPYWSLTRSYEVMEDNIITVLGRSDEMSRLCSACAGERPTVYDFVRDGTPGVRR